MQDMFTGQIVARRDLGLPDRFGKPLFFHHIRAREPQLYASECMDAVVDAGMIRLVAPRHAAVGSIDDCVRLQSRNISLPQINALLHRL